jgi:membrane protein implicated in regulation of membrane protease activity
MNERGWVWPAAIAVVGTIIITVLLAFLNVAGLVSIVITFVLLFFAARFVQRRRVQSRP